MKWAAMLVAAFLLSGCQDESHKHLLQSKGYTNVEVSSGSFNMSCGMPGPTSSFHSDFKAVKNNVAVSGSVCEGIFGSSIVENK